MEDNGRLRCEDPYNVDVISMDLLGCGEGRKGHLDLHLLARAKRSHTELRRGSFSTPPSHAHFHTRSH